MNRRRKVFRSYAAAEEGEKLRIRSETFADHFSQARQFFISQTETEQNHIIDAFTFELSKVEKLAIRERMVAQLVNVDPGLAEKIANGLGLKSLPKSGPCLMNGNIHCGARTDTQVKRK